MNYEVTVRTVVDRISVLLRPRVDACPFPRGATVEEWATAAGLGCTPHPILEPLKPIPLDRIEGPVLAREALSRLAVLGRVEPWKGGYRPMGGG